MLPNRALRTLAEFGSGRGTTVAHHFFAPLASIKARRGNDTSLLPCGERGSQKAGNTVGYGFCSTQGHWK